MGWMVQGLIPSRMKKFFFFPGSGANQAVE